MLAPEDLYAMRGKSDPGIIERTKTVSYDSESDDAGGVLATGGIPADPFVPARKPRLLTPLGNVQIAGNGGAYTFRTDPAPDWWLVTVANIAGVTVAVVVGEGGGVPVARLGPGGYCRVPAAGEAITLTTLGATACTPVVVAARGYGDLEAGDILVCPGVGTGAL